MTAQPLTPEEERAWRARLGEEEGKVSDEEGAICDECGSRIGPGGCCATRRRVSAEAAQDRREAEELRDRLAQSESGAAALRAALDRCECEWGRVEPRSGAPRSAPPSSGSASDAR